MTRHFIAKVKSDFDADAVAIRNIWKGDHFVAAVLVLRTRRPLAVKAIAKKVMPRVGSPPVAFDVGGKPAYLVTALVGPHQNSVIDTVGRIVIVVAAENGDVALKLAKPYVR